MTDYKGWSEKIADPINAKAHSEFLVLDLQFGGACNMHCIYCDTPKYKEPCLLELEALEKILKEGKIEWIHSCGLGEPTNESNIHEENNMFFLLNILEMCKKYDIKMTVFSNILNMTDKIKQYIDDGILHIVYKFDTFNPKLMEYLYGISEQQAKKLVLNRESLMEVHHVDEYGSNLAISTVLTLANYPEINDIIDYHEDKKIHYLLGQLEDVGQASKCADCKVCALCGQKNSFFSHNQISLTQLNRIKQYIHDTYGYWYEPSSCTGAYSAIHINNRNKVVCDELTGMDCPWPLMEEPKLKVLGDITTMSIGQITRAKLDYRKEVYPQISKLEQSAQSFPMGGCGGDLKRLVKSYANTVRRQDNMKGIIQDE